MKPQPEFIKHIYKAVVPLFKKGLTNPEIKKKLGITIQEVRFYRQRYNMDSPQIENIVAKTLNEVEKEKKKSTELLREKPSPVIKDSARDLTIDPEFLRSLGTQPVYRGTNYSSELIPYDEKTKEFFKRIKSNIQAGIVEDSHQEEKKAGFNFWKMFGTIGDFFKGIFG